MEANMRSQIRVTYLAFAALGFACAWGAAQKTEAAGPQDDPGAMVHLEAHVGQTQFKLGDPVILDLVFTSSSRRYVVDTDTNPYRPASDVVNISPEGGWVRSDAALQGQGLNGNALATLGADPVRVPVLLNRTITFEEPGHYEVTLTTERLQPSPIFGPGTTLAGCNLCRTTNAVSIDIVTRDESEEPALVAELSRELEDTKEGAPRNGLSAEQKEDIQREFEAAQKAGFSSEAGKKQLESLQQKLNRAIAAEVARSEKRKEVRREAAVRLACLTGDDAVRAKVRFIVAGHDGSDGDPVSFIMVDGLPSSSNKQFQMDLLEAAWRDPTLVPTGALQNALREAKQLTYQPWVTDEGMHWSGSIKERQAALDEYHREIDEIAATLPQRTETNRAETIHFLKSLGAPNQFNQRP
jgi:hypothetical protein